MINDKAEVLFITFAGYPRFTDPMRIWRKGIVTELPAGFGAERVEAFNNPGTVVGVKFNGAMSAQAHRLPMEPIGQHRPR